jgi:3-methyladenine DNA glycosylase AlkD
MVITTKINKKKKERRYLMRVIQMSLEDVLAQLEAWGNEKRRVINAENGAGLNQFGVGKTGNTDAMILATMLMESNMLSKQEIEQMVTQITYSTLIDEFVYNVIMKTTFSEELGKYWLDSPEEFIGRAGWNIQIAKILAGKKESTDCEVLLADMELFL